MSVTVAGEDLKALLEALIQLHPSSPSFRQIFKSTQVTQQFVGTHLAFASAVRSLPEISQRVTSLMDKMCHFAIALALDPSVSQTQQAEVIYVLLVHSSQLTPPQLMAAVEEAQNVLNPNVSSANNPQSIPERQLTRHKLSSSINSTVGERAVQKSVQRLQDWRKTIMISERKRLRRTAIDM